MPSKRETKGAGFRARRRRFMMVAGSCPGLPDVPAHAAPDMPHDAEAPSVFTRIRAMRERLSLGRGVSAKDLINEGREGGHATAAEGRRALLAAEGGCVGLREACLLFQKPRPVTSRTLTAFIRKGAVIGYHRGGGHYAVPVWQFRRGGGLLKGLPEVLRSLRSRVPGHGQLSPFAFFLQADPVTDNRTPLAALRDGETLKVLDAVKARVS